MNYRVAIASFAAVAGLQVPSSAAAQNSSAPPTTGSQQRAAIMNAVRPAIEVELGPNVEFVINCIQVWNGWALLNAEPRRRGGRPIDPRVLPDWEYRDGLTTTALLRFRYGRWNVVGHQIGATDVWYDGIAPRRLQSARCY